MGQHAHGLFVVQCSLKMALFFLVKYLVLLCSGFLCSVLRFNNFHVHCAVHPCFRKKIKCIFIFYKYSIKHKIKIYFLLLLLSDFLVKLMALCSPCVCVCSKIKFKIHKKKLHIFKFIFNLPTKFI